MSTLSDQKIGTVSDKRTGSLALSPEFLRLNPMKSSSSSAVPDVRDPLEQHVASRRTELETLDTQIASLDRTIELEQQKLIDSREALQSSYHSRARLLQLREAMLQFVLDLESRRV